MGSKKKDGRGGKRAGAGRKPMGEEPMAEVSLRVPKSVLALLEEQAAVMGVTRAAWMRRCLERGAKGAKSQVAHIDGVNKYLAGD